MKDCEKVVVLDRGRIVAEGRHEDVVRDCPVYGEMAREQHLDEPG